LLCLSHLQVSVVPFVGLGADVLCLPARTCDLDGPDAADGSIPRRGSELNLAFRKPEALRIVRAMEGTQPKVRRLVKALPAKRAWNATRGERRA
jgi:hypothetical protein